MDERQELPIWKVMAATAVLLVSGAIGAGPALAEATDTAPLPGYAQPWDDDENDGNDRHPSRLDDDDDDDDDHDGLDLDDLLENLADVLEEVADVIDDLL